MKRSLSDLVPEPVLERIAALPTPEEKFAALQAALVLVSRKNRFVVTWCLHYMGYRFTYAGRHDGLANPAGPPLFVDEDAGVKTDDPGSGVLAAFRVAENLAAWNGGVLAIEHPEQNLHESHAAPMADLLVQATLGIPWERDLKSWADAGCPKDFGGFMP